MVISSLNRVAPQNISRHHFQKNLNPSTYILLTPPTIDPSTFWRLKKRRKNFFDKSQKTQSIKKRNKKRRRRNQLCVFQFISLSSSFTLLGNIIIYTKEIFHSSSRTLVCVYLSTNAIYCLSRIFLSLVWFMSRNGALYLKLWQIRDETSYTDAGTKNNKNTLLLLFLFSFIDSMRIVIVYMTYKRCAPPAVTLSFYLRNKIKKETFFIILVMGLKRQKIKINKRNM
jgi:hypothetical protein